MMEPLAWGALGAAAGTDEVPSTSVSVEQAQPMDVATPSWSSCIGITSAMLPEWRPWNSPGSPIGLPADS